MIDAQRQPEKPHREGISYQPARNVMAILWVRALETVTNTVFFFIALVFSNEQY
jgi:hypothetical protein